MASHGRGRRIGGGSGASGGNGFDGVTTRPNARLEMGSLANGRCCKAGMWRWSSPHGSGGTCFGGVAVMHQLVREFGLAEAIDRRLELLKWHKPYHKSDHVLNFAYNALCVGDCLDDTERRRTDEVYLDSLGVVRMPDPTTAGDFCRRLSVCATQDNLCRF